MRRDLAAESFGSERSERSEDREKKVKDGHKKEAGSIVKGLSLSHDVAEAVSQIRDLKPRQSSQKGLFVEILKRALEASDRDRTVLWQFTVRLFSEEVLQKSVLMEGLTQFMEEVYDDLKCDVPRLPKILQEELFPVLSGDGEGEATATLLDSGEIQKLTDLM